VSNRQGLLGLLVALPLLLTGCGAAADATSGQAASTTTATTGTSSSTPGDAPTSAGPVLGPPMPAAGPSKSALMICGKEIREAVATIMALRAPAPAKATWVNHTYTCTYQLPVGPLVLSVKDSQDVPAARQFFKTLAEHLGPVKTLTGQAALGLSGFQTSTGTVVFLKDNRTLKVDATKLPGRVGPQNASRTALAYQVAKAVMECWTGN
jgi:hypothetical protein